MPASPLLARLRRVAAGLALTVVLVPAQAADNDAVAELFVQALDVEVTAIANPAFDGVFDAPIYDIVATRFADDERFSPESESRVYRAGDRLVPIFAPGSNTELAYFEGLLVDEFRLTEDTAEDFRAALRGLMPDGFFETVDGPAVRRVDGQWQFLTGEFFDDMKGFVVEVDGEGRIESVGYALKL